MNHNFFELVDRYRLQSENLSAYARRLGVSRARLNAWRKSTPHFKSINQIAKTLGVQPRDLLFPKEDTHVGTR